MTQPSTTPAEADRPREMSHREVVAVLSGLMIGMFLAALDQSIVGTALKTIVTDLGGAEHVSWVVAAYLITSTVTTPLYGKLSDLYGRKPVYQFAIGIFVLGSVLAGFSQSMVMLILARAVQGLGGGGLLSLAFTIVGDLVSPRERGKYQGYFGAVFGVSSVAGPLLGGLFTDTIGWHWIFFVNVPIGVLAWLVVGARLNLPFTRRDHHLDYLGALVLVAGVSALLLVTQWGGQEYAWGSGQVVGLSVLAALLLVGFVLVERRSPEPILPPRLFRNRTFSLVNGAQFVIALGMFGAIIYVPFYLQLVRGYTATGAGLLMIPVVGGILVTSIGSGQAISRFGRWKPFPVAGAAVFTVGLALTATLTTTTPTWLLGAYLAVIGAGLGLTMQTLVLAVQNDSDPAELGVATSSVAFSRSLGGAIGTAIFGAIVTAGTTTLPGSTELDTAAYTDAVARGFLVAVPLGVLALVLVSLLRATRLGASSGLVAQAAQREARRAEAGRAEAGRAEAGRAEAAAAQP